MKKKLALCLAAIATPAGARTFFYQCGKHLFALTCSALALAFAAAQASGQQTPRPHTIVITSDYGGLVSKYWERWKTVAISGDEVEIRGKCYSACTLVIAAVPKDRICFSRYATLGFHLVAQERGVMPDGRGPPGMEATQWMLDQYPKDIRDWIEIRGGLKKLPYHYDVWTLSAPDLWEMGYRRCAEPQLPGTCLKSGEGGVLVECTPELK